MGVMVQLMDAFPGLPAPNPDEPIVATCSQHHILQPIAPANGVEVSIQVLEHLDGRAFIGLPNTAIRVCRATGQELTRRVPLDLHNVCVMALPLLNGGLLLVNVPQVNILALACHYQLLLVLPLNLTAHEILLQLVMVEHNNDFASLRIPDSHLAGHSSTGYLIAIILVELGHHEHHLEVLHPVDSLAVFTHLVLFIYFPHTGVAIRRSDEFVSAVVPMHTNHICYGRFCSVLRLGLHMRQHVHLFKIIGIVTSQIPKAGLVEVSSHEEKSLRRTELGPLDVSIPVSLLICWAD
jgi:hypothetical protein